ncbi:Arc family DNA-binding protein (plasmid) [Agrobacterium tumefaciens]|uniref:FitA-like ribbon-helix-helix domain-containing protein n=1 Tax=Agrobacterium tumefaciens TaxID=358 RepID=UPI000E0BAB75|nr:Arc family DNA-binding protein [Agrobacterium tumefaciens]WQE43507.1 Arc family DNA-binding protein [Agrobacterium tumefaciens]
MPSITIRNVPDEVYRAIRVRAAMHGRSAEAEIHTILEQAARPQGRLKLGTLLTSIACDAEGLTGAESEFLNQLRDKTPADALSFE